MKTLEKLLDNGILFKIICGDENKDSKEFKRLFTIDTLVETKGMNIPQPQKTYKSCLLCNTNLRRSEN
ncbi:hypothetical protein HN615_07095 [Candidatus Woesearchaeota archaeon]|nr:hypothetical protein [Candidatus Woesearchaeota archaeon]